MPPGGRWKIDMPSIEGRTRCVLLTPTGGGGEPLRTLLDRRTAGQWEAHEADEPLAAFAELCLLDRTQKSRVGWGQQQVEGLALVVVEPTRWPQLDAMLAAARRYVPQADLWSYVDGTLSPLASGHEPVTQPTAKDTGPTHRAASESKPSPPSDTPQITQEEIAMLLDNDDRGPSK